MNDGLLNVREETIGSFDFGPSGTVIQRGGTHVVQVLEMGVGYGRAEYLMTAGTLMAGPVSMAMTRNARATFTQTGGIVIVDGTLTVSSNNFDSMKHATGVYRLSGTGELVAGRIEGIYNTYWGAFAMGGFYQSSGTCRAGVLVTGSYELSGGQMIADTEYVGALVQSGGSHRVTSALSFDPWSTFTASNGSAIHHSGTVLVNSSATSANLSGLVNLNLIVEGEANVLAFEAAGKDLGAVAAGWTNNYVLGTLTLGNVETLASSGTGSGAIKLVNSSSNNSGWSGAEALYVNNLVLNAGATINLNGLHLYYLVNGVPHSFTGTLLPGDANLDGIVDQADYTAWYNGYGTAGGWSAGDFTGDRLVDQADYTAWYNAYGATGGTVPEPFSALLMIVGCLAVVGRRRRATWQPRSR